MTAVGHVEVAAGHYGGLGLSWCVERHERVGDVLWIEGDSVEVVDAVALAHAILAGMPA